MRCWKHQTEPRDAESCEMCAKAYDSYSSPCSRCGALVTNGAFFKKTSPHFKGTCRPPKAFPDTIPEPSWKRPLPYPMPLAPKYDCKSPSWRYGKKVVFEWPSTMAELCAFWGVKSIGKSKPTVKDRGNVIAQLIAKMEEQNRLLRNLRVA